MKIRFIGALLAGLLLAGTATAQQLLPVTNNSGGTTNGLIAKGTGAPTQALTITTSDTQGLLGIVANGGGTSGTAYIVASGGPVNCTFDAGNVVANHWVQASASVAGNCHDSGAVAANPALAGQIIGISAATGTGSQPIYVIPLPGIASVTGATLGGTNTFTGPNTFNNNILGLDVQNTTTTITLDSTVICGQEIFSNNAGAVTATLNSTFPAQCEVSISNQGAGLVSVVAGTGTLHKPASGACSVGTARVQYSVIRIKSSATAGTAYLSGDCT